jgi:hypothetical protein
MQALQRLFAPSSLLRPNPCKLCLLILQIYCDLQLQHCNQHWALILPIFLPVHFVLVVPWHCCVPKSTLMSSNWWVDGARMKCSVTCISKLTRKCTPLPVSWSLGLPLIYPPTATFPPLRHSSSPKSRRPNTNATFSFLFLCRSCPMTLFFLPKKQIPPSIALHAIPPCLWFSLGSLQVWKVGGNPIVK